MTRNINKQVAIKAMLYGAVFSTTILSAHGAESTSIEHYASFEETTGELSVPCISFLGDAFRGTLQLGFREGFGEYVRPIAADSITGNIPDNVTCVETQASLTSDNYRADYKSLPLLQNGVDTGLRFDVQTLVDTSDPNLDFRIIGLYDSECVVTAPPTALELDPFYTKYCNANGLPVISSDLVPDAALHSVRREVLEMTSARPDVLAEMIKNKVRVAIMATTEVTTDIPEHSDLNEAAPATDWDNRARGLGATVFRPASSAAEENVMCYSNDRYLGEDINIHEFAHSMDLTGLRLADNSWEQRLTDTYQAAMNANLWQNTYAATNKEEYFAEGVQSWFDVNLQAIPSDGIHNQVNTRAELEDYDKGLYDLVASVMPANWSPSCP
ncbi:MAG: hypothetical protein WD600_10185 [Pseudohongiella sp.]